MKKYFIILAGLAAAAMVSCTKEFNPESVSAGKTLTLSVSREIPGEDTKSALSGTSVVFQANDEVSVLSGSENAKFTTAAGGATASFSGTASEAEQYLVLSPYNANATLASPSVVNFTIPSVQVATPDGVDPNALISAGIFRPGDSSVQLYNAVGLVKIEVPSGITAKQIQIGGGRGATIGICGDFTFNASTQVVGVVSMSRIITLVPAEGEDVIAPGTYYIAVRPKPDFEGLVVAYLNGDNVLCKRISSEGSMIYINRSHIVPIGSLDSNYSPVTGRATLRYAGDAPQFTGLLKQLAGGATAANASDNAVKKIVFKAHTLYSQEYKGQVTVNGNKIANVISNGPNSDIQIHAWVEDGTAYVYTEAPVITLYNASANLFRDFAGLEEVSFNDVNAMDGASFEYLFRNCTSLKSVDFGNADFSKVANWSFAFVTANLNTGVPSALESVSLGETATTSATNMTSMFSQAFVLKNLYLGKNFALAPSVNGMFNGTASVTTTQIDDEGHGMQCKLFASQALWDALNVDLNDDGVNATTLFNTHRFFFTPVE
ncbi:MAG: hypothetical protein J6S97_01815 [Bacteroidales bacterium]|nr:hypothetical protein [Bacteroidales bacterium]